MVQALWLEQEVDALVRSGHKAGRADCSLLATMKTPKRVCCAPMCTAVSRRSEVQCCAACLQRLLRRPLPAAAALRTEQATAIRSQRRAQQPSSTSSGRSSSDRCDARGFCHAHLLLAVARSTCTARGLPCCVAGSVQEADSSLSGSSGVLGTSFRERDAGENQPGRGMQGTVCQPDVN